MIQTIGRAARNLHGRVILYADKETDSIKKAVGETNRRRKIQADYNELHGITPQTIKKKIAEGLSELFDGSLNREKLTKKDQKIKEKEIKTAEKESKQDKPVTIEGLSKN